MAIPTLVGSARCSTKQGSCAVLFEVEQGISVHVSRPERTGPRELSTSLFFLLMCRPLRSPRTTRNEVAYSEAIRQTVLFKKVDRDITRPRMFRLDSRQWDCLWNGLRVCRGPCEVGHSGYGRVFCHSWRRIQSQVRCNVSHAPPVPECCRSLRCRLPRLLDRF